MARDLSEKKILCFSGRIHHFQKLSCVVNMLRENGASALYLASDNAVNIDPAVEYLIPAGEMFVHALDYLTPELVGKTTEATRLLLGMIYAHGDHASDITVDVSPFWMSYSVREACEFLLACDKLLEIEAPHAVMLLHENNFWTKSVSYLCSRRGIPTFVFQEGLIRHRDQATLGKQSLSSEYATRLLVWSESARQAYLDAGVLGEKAKTVGIPHLDKWFDLLRNREAAISHIMSVRSDFGFRPAPLVVFCPPLLSRFDGNPNTALGRICDWSANRFTQVAIRFHPFENRENVERVREKISGHPYAKVVECDTLSLIAAGDVVISQHSTVAVEAIALGRPLVEIDLDNAGVLESFADQGVAVPVRSGEELDKISEILSGKIGPDPAKLQAWISRNVGERDGKSTERVVSELAAEILL